MATPPINEDTVTSFVRSCDFDQSPCCQAITNEAVFLFEERHRIKEKRSGIVLLVMVVVVVGDREMSNAV